jgi:hypothetical protein
VLASIGNKSATVGTALSFVVSATDADAGQALTYTTSTLPSGATFNVSTRTFSWTPTAGQVGTASVTFTVTDNGTPVLNDSETITVTVTAAAGNQAPVLASIGNKSATVGTALSFMVSATDADAGQTLTYSAVNLPAGAMFDASTRTFSWIPAGEGTTTVTFVVTDNGTPALNDTETVMITVSPQGSANDVVWTNLLGVAATGNSVVKTAATNWGNASATSTVTMSGNVGVEFKAMQTTGYAMAGLAASNPNGDKVALTFSIYFTPGSVVKVRESGVDVKTLGTYTTSDVYSVERSGTAIIYKKNGAVVHTSTKTSTGNLLAATVLYTQNAGISNAKFLIVP